jgi:Fe-S cluster biogenesis protein NfuA
VEEKMFQFSADHYFQIGTAHYTAGKPCQDYALSGSNDQVACALVSDGCSTGRHTDVGARVLTLSTLQAIREHAKASGGTLTHAIESITARQQQLIGTARIMFGLEHADMLATCAYVYVTKEGGYTHVQGDGVVAVKYRNGNIRMYRYEWVDNTPFYPSYKDGDITAFIQAHGGDLSATRVSLHTVLYNNQGECVEDSSSGYSLREGLEGMVFWMFPHELEEIEFIAVFSDGVTQIDGIEWKDAVFSFLSFKNIMGDFAKRRMIREIKDMSKVGKGPVDDIAYAVVRIEPTMKEESA